MLSSEDKILTKTCGNVKDFLPEDLSVILLFPNKNWKRWTWQHFLQKLRTTGLIERTPGSSVPSQTAVNAIWLRVLWCSYDIIIPLSIM